MKAGNGTRVTLEYTIRDESGAIVESSENSGLLSFTLGESEVPAGLERAVRGHRSGSSLKIRIDPSEGYGHRDPGLVRSVSKVAFRGFGEPRKGLMFRAYVDGSERICKVLKRDGDMVTYDANHPLAGIVLDFDITIVDVRGGPA